MRKMQLIRINKPLLLIVIAILAGCSLSSDYSWEDDMEDTMELRILLSHTPFGYEKYMEDYLEAYKQKYPDISISIVKMATDDDYLQLDKMIEKYQPDIVEVTPFHLHLYSELFVDLSELTNASQTNIDDFYPALLEASMISGQLKTIPYEYNIKLMLYNKRILDNMGLSYPDNGWTWEKAVEIFQLMEHHDTYFTPIGGPYPMGDLEPIVLSKGGQFLSPDTYEANGYLNNSSTLEAIEWFLDLSRDKPCYQFCYYDRLARGEVGFLVASSFYNFGFGTTFRESIIENEDIGAVSIPYFQDGERITTFNMSGLSIVQHSNHYEAAWDFIRFALIEESNIASQVALDRIFSTRKSVSLESGFDQHWLGKVVLQELEYAKPSSISYSSYVTSSNLLIKANGFDVERDMYEEDDISIVLEQMARNWDATLKKLLDEYYDG